MLLVACSFGREEMESFGSRLGAVDFCYGHVTALPSQLRCDVRKREKEIGKVVVNGIDTIAYLRAC